MGWERTRGAAIAALIAAGLTLAPAPASAVNGAAPTGPQAADRKDRVSPYARFAREHQQLVGKNPARRSGLQSQRRPPRTAGHTRR